MRREERRFLNIEENFGKYDFEELILAQDELKFENITQDWNWDGDVYTLNVCLFEGRYGRNYYTKENFKYSFVEVNNLEEDKMFLDTRTYVAYDKILKFNYKREKLVYLENINDKILLTQEEFKTYMKEIREVVEK